MRRQRWTLQYKGLDLLIGASMFVMLSACSGGQAPGATSPGATIRVVAAENFWGSLAAQVGKERVTVVNIIANPDTDPHDYEATPSDGRAIASAQYVILNGLGYDPWADELLKANPASSRAVLRVQDVLHLKDDDNPHRWYSPTDVMNVIDAITTDYKKLAPGDAALFDKQRSDFVSSGLQQYTTLVQQIKQKYAGTPIGATESIVAPLADALGLKLISPPEFLQAISQGTDPTARDKVTFDQQIQSKQIAVLIFNTQNATPDVQRLVNAARSKGIPIVGITETPVPATATFQDWQGKQLEDLANALAKATGR